jgi:hypothetical protein
MMSDTTSERAEMDVIAGDEAEITALHIVHFVPRTALHPRTARPAMLRAFVCKVTEHKWGENIHEVTHSGRRIFRVCARCHVEDTIATIRDLDPAWRPRLSTRGGNAA